jgi:uncharacterized membrane protein
MDIVTEETTRHWTEAHPAFEAPLTLGERSADRMRHGMGSWAFVFAFIAFMLVWAAWNGTTGFDPFPFILLNLFLSMLAGLQGAILLISAKRADQISGQLALHTDRMATETRSLLEDIRTSLTQGEAMAGTMGKPGKALAPKVSPPKTSGKPAGGPAAPSGGGQMSRGVHTTPTNTKAKGPK